MNNLIIYDKPNYIKGNVDLISVETFLGYKVNEYSGNNLKFYLMIIRKLY